LILTDNREGLSGQDLKRVIKAKHDADPQLSGHVGDYAAKAIVETVDVDRLFDKSVAKGDKTRGTQRSRRLPRDSERPTSSWLGRQMPVSRVEISRPTDEALLLHLDLKTFETASKAITEILTRWRVVFFLLTVRSRTHGDPP